MEKLLNKLTVVDKVEIFNPIAKTDEIHTHYFDFFQSSFAPNNRNLQEKLTKLKKSRYLWREPYITISKKYELGEPFKNFEVEHIHDKVKLGFKNITRLFRFQEEGIRNILNSRNTIISTETGSGKTEVFMIPILNYCFENRDKPGVKAILIYPMNALANDQVERLRKALYYINQGIEKKITFAIYTGETPDSVDELKDFSGVEENHIATSEEERRKLGCESYCDKLLYDVENLRLKCRCGNLIIDFQKLTRKQIRENPPDILITNYVQLEHLLLRKKDEKLFSNGQIKFIVFDEIHAYRGSRGIDVALLNRRLLSRIRKYKNPEPIYIGTSATISTIKNEERRKKETARFGSQLFGVEFTTKDVIEGRELPITFDETPFQLDKVTKIPEIESVDSCSEETFVSVCKSIYPQLKEEEIKKIPKKDKSLYLGSILLRNPFFQTIINALKTEPANFDEIISRIEDDPLYQRTFEDLHYNNSAIRDIIWSYLKVGSIAEHPKLSTDEERVPLIRVNVHNFFKTIERIYQCNKCGKLFIKPRNTCDKCSNSVDELGVCRFCGKEFIITYVNAEELKEFHRKKVGRRSEESKISNALGEEVYQPIRLAKHEYSEEFTGKILPLWQSYEKGVGSLQAKKCIACGAILDKNDENCNFCGTSELKVIYLYVREKFKPRYESVELSPETQPHNCPFCNNSYGRFSALSPVSMSSNTTAVTLFDIVYSSLPENLRKLLIFTDNRQAASYLAGYLEDGHLDFALRGLFYKIIREEKRILFQDLREKILHEIGIWFGEIEPKRWNEINRKIYLELTTSTGRQRSVENLGLIEVTYKGLETLEEFKSRVKNTRSDFPISLSTTEDFERFRCYLISLLNIFRTETAISGLHQGYGRDPVVGFVEEEKPRYIDRSDIIQLKPALSTHPLAKTFLLTRDTFNLSDIKYAKKILQFAFRFLKENNLLILVHLTKWGRRADAFVVNSNNIVMKIPDEVFFCGKCKRAYTNLPRGVCLTYRCDGRPEKLNYESFVQQIQNYYVDLYRRRIPVKMVVEEDTGALESSERRKIESEFKKSEFRGRKVDVIVATPTLELGVDIGDLVSIGLFKSPPSPVNYLQRVGRAGRREKISFNNTFLFLTPIDKFYFKQPQKLIRGEVETPIVKLDKFINNLLQRHINSLILENLLIHSSKAEKYEEINIYNMFNFVSNNLFEELISDINSRSDELIEQISLTLKDSQFDWITDNDISISIKIFVESIRRVVERYNKELDWQERKLDMINKRLKERNISQSDKRDLRNRRIEVETQIEKLKEKTSLISYFMDMNILPRYAFPGIFVAISDVRGFEDFSGRARNYAITEYAPNMEVYLKKAIYKSMGVDFEFFQPTSKSFFICPKCEKFATEYVTDLQNGCPICGSRSSEIKSVDAIEPNRIYIRKTNRPIYEPIEFQEALSNVYFFSRNITQNHIPFVEPNIQIVDYGNIELLQVVSGISINGDSFPIELCDRCGKVKEPDEFIKPKPHYKLASEGKCNGRYRKLSLYHRMPTNVISLKLKGSLFGVNIENIFEKMKKIKPSLTMENFQLILLTTLKNALINGAQRLLQTEDGEIDGEVKDSEIILFDNVDGGVGYVSEIARRFEDVLKEAAEMVLDPDDDCESGCLECLWSYRRKRDIEFIDKRCIKEIFEAFRKKILSEKISLEGEIKKSPEYRGKNIRTVHSPPYSFAGINELKNLLRGAREEIILTSLYVTDDKIPWEDETEKSWVDILVDIKSSSPPLKITVIVKEPTSEKHKEALKRLSDRGINVKIFRKEIEKMLPSIVHSKLIVIDPHIPSTRYAVHTSANFSPEMWKNHETFDFGNDEEWVKGTYKEIRNIIEQSLDFKG